MGTRKKAVKKSKSKLKKHSPVKNADHGDSQEVPNMREPGDVSDTSGSEMPDVKEEFSTVTETDTENEKAEEKPMQAPADEPMPARADEPNDDQKVPDVEGSPMKPLAKHPSLCHSRIGKLKEECGGRLLSSRKHSLQEQPKVAKKDARRVSFADLGQVKHPLQDTWVFWYYMGNKYKQWNENLRKVCTIGTVEDFWCLYNDLISPSQLSPGKDFYFFKKHIRPEWEDPENEAGGMWSFSPKEKSQKPSEIDKVWLEVLMFLIGDQFDTLTRYVNGVAYSKRKAQDRISLWIGRTDNEQIMRIGQALKLAISNATHSIKLEYSTSDDWKLKSGSTVTVRMAL